MKTQIMSDVHGGTQSATGTMPSMSPTEVQGRTRPAPAMDGIVGAGDAHGGVGSDGAPSTAPHLPVGELVEVLRDQLAAHHRLLQLEMAKREAIIARDGELLKKSATEQANELHRLDLLDSRRNKLVGRIMPGQADAALAEIMESGAVTAPEKQELGRYLSALRGALFELKKLSDVNTRMLIDSRDLFKTMMLNLAGRGQGNEHKVARPVLVDANC
ncbi:flagellar export chaperone FlgN [Turneriella parva]|uniref:FlgN family protein n=1 Tax=Turneriella parva (strain ATCC BAA-1111 / DSM 21527 / NCTC 11395 / H) TaxID=869212 RepID=I4B4I6_TURPD|nr:flagellar export chaperone FlgN [Turneriella parva]AFM12193.1 hypothetical protein Turpa_1545 [Turneriella parva DSM 21527]